MWCARWDALSILSESIGSMVRNNEAGPVVRFTLSRLASLSEGQRVDDAKSGHVPLEDDRRDYGRDRRYRHLCGVEIHVCTLTEQRGRQRRRDGVQAVRIGEEERQHELVPGGEPCEDRHRGDAGRSDRDQYFREQSSTCCSRRFSPAYRCPQEANQSTPIAPKSSEARSASCPRV